MMAHFVSLGSAAQKLLNKSGYAYGSIVQITHSDSDKEVQQEVGPVSVKVKCVSGGAVAC